MVKLSIVIPTRNRPRHLRYAIASLCDQEYRNLEILVSDNSDDENLQINKEFVEQKEDDRIVYKRPSSTMSMVDHWNWAVEQATGDYIGILTDRMVFKKGAIRRLAHMLMQYSPDVLGYQHDRIEGESAPLTYVAKQATGLVIVVKCSDVISKAACCPTNRQWPRMLNCVCHNKILSEISREYGKVFSGIAPDYSFCFRIMDWLDEYHFLEESLIISGGLDVSNGRAFARRDRNLINDYVKLTEMVMTEDEKKILDRWLFPLDSSVPGNAEMFEYMRAMKEQRSGKFVDVNLQAFHDNTVKTLYNRRRSGLDTKLQRKELKEFRVRHGLRKSELNSPAKGAIKALMRVIARSRSSCRERDVPVNDIWDARQQD